jgi:hypothetical protein
MTTCLGCGAQAPDKPALTYAVRMDDRWLSRFTYPQGDKDKEWEKSEGLRLASHCKALPGDRPYVWNNPDSAQYVAKTLGGKAGWLCEACTPEDKDKPHGRRRRR